MNMKSLQSVVSAHPLRVRYAALVAGLAIQVPMIAATREVSIAESISTAGFFWLSIFILAQMAVFYGMFAFAREKSDRFIDRLHDVGPTLLGSMAYVVTLAGFGSLKFLWFGFAFLVVAAIPPLSRTVGTAIAGRLFAK